CARRGSSYGYFDVW
nr:immunoglobulin heavy chain junction region [Mus musculus]